MALINKLNNIGDAIRAKTGKEDKLTLEQMVTEIAAIETSSEPNLCGIVIEENGIYNAEEYTDGEYQGFFEVEVNVPTGGGDLPEEAFAVTGNCQYRFANNGWNWFIENYGNQISTKNITDLGFMFSWSDTLQEIPFEINMNSASTASATQLFYGNKSLLSVPKINNFKPENMGSMFYDCYRIREIPSDFCENWNWSYMDTSTNGYGCNRSKTFQNCYSLRSFPMEFLAHGCPMGQNSYSIYYYTFNYCYVLDEIVDLPFPHYNRAWTTNVFSSTFTLCGRLKKLTFALQEDGTPYTMQWKNQTIELQTNVGRSNQNSSVTGYNSGITADKLVTDDATYQALKNDPDWWTLKDEYSRYNHDSAVETINSLPDTSAYLAANGGTNTIKFKGIYGSATDGGAINTLTEEEIAVAAAKGWTVTLV